jgi:hypothetical protein
MEMRSKMRAEPNMRISLPKHKKFVDNRGDYYPNKDFDPVEGDIHYPEDIHDKNHFYDNLRNRLDYNRSHSKHHRIFNFC